MCENTKQTNEQKKNKKYEFVVISRAHTRFGFYRFSPQHFTLVVYGYFLLLLLLSISLARAVVVSIIFIYIIFFYFYIVIVYADFDYRFNFTLQLNYFVTSIWCVIIFWLHTLHHSLSFSCPLLNRRVASFSPRCCCNYSIVCTFKYWKYYEQSCCFFSLSLFLLCSCYCCV